MTKKAAPLDDLKAAIRAELYTHSLAYLSDDPLALVKALRDDANRAYERDQEHHHEAQAGHVAAVMLFAWLRYCESTGTPNTMGWGTLSTLPVGKALDALIKTAEQMKLIGD